MTEDSSVLTHSCVAQGALMCTSVCATSAQTCGHGRDRCMTSDSVMHTVDIAALDGGRSGCSHSQEG